MNKNAWTGLVKYKNTYKFVKFVEQSYHFTAILFIRLFITDGKLIYVDIDIPSFRVSFYIKFEI